MSRLPDFEALAMFARVAEEGSYAAAARTLGISVATVSRAVSRLEDRLGGRLFNRNSRRLALTEFGQSLAERAGQMFAEAERIEADGLETARRPRGTVKLAVPMSFGVRWVALLLPDFLELYPEVSIDLHLGDNQVDLIGDGIDAALRIAVLENSSLVVKQLAPVRRYIVAAPSYLVQHGRPDHPGELDVHHCLGYTLARRDVWQFTNAAGDEATITPDGRLRATNVEALIPTVLAGAAVAELPEFIAADLIRSGQVEALLPGWIMAAGGLYFTTPTARARSARVEALSGFLAERLAQPAWRLP